MRAAPLGLVTAVIGAALVGMAVPANADLHNRGTDTNGNRLIYDSDLNVTWYDLTNYAGGSSSWYYYLDWASGLSVEIAGTVYDDWRLPTTAVMEDPRVHAYSGATTYGYNISSSEMGHLFHTELGNKSYYATDGSYPQPGWGLTNTGPFQHLQAASYYSQTEDGPWTAVYFSFWTGEQYVAARQALGGTGLSAIAVRPGDVVPEPTLSIFLIAAGMLLARGRFSRAN